MEPFIRYRVSLVLEIPSPFIQAWSYPPHLSRLGVTLPIYPGLGLALEQTDCPSGWVTPPPSPPLN